MTKVIWVCADLGGVLLGVAALLLGLTLGMWWPIAITFGVLVAFGMAFVGYGTRPLNLLSY